MKDNIRWMMKMQSSIGLCSFDEWVLDYIDTNELLNKEDLIVEADKNGFSTEVRELLRSLSESNEDS